MKRAISIFMIMVMMLSLLPQYTVRAEEAKTEFNWDAITKDSSNGDKEAALSEAKSLVSDGKATLVTVENWTTGGAYKDENSHYWTNNSNISMETVSDGGVNVVKITSKEAKANDYEGQANFRMRLNVKSGDKLFYAFRIKAVSKDDNTESGTVTTSLRIRPDVDKTGSGEDIRLENLTYEVGEDWKLVCGIGSTSIGSSTNLDKPFGAVIFQQGKYVEEFMIKDLCVINLGQDSVEDESNNANNPNEDADDVVEDGEKAFADVIALYEEGKATLLTAEEWDDIGSKDFNNTWVDANTSMTSADVKAVAVTDEVYGKSIKITTTKKASGNYHAQIFFKIRGKVDKNDQLFYAFRMKGISNADNSGEAVTNMRIRPSNLGDAQYNFTRDNIKETIDDEWTLVWGYADAADSSSNSDSEDSNGKFGAFVLQAGMAQEEFQIADFKIFNLDGIPGEVDVPEETVEKLTFEEVMQAYADGKGTLVTYPDIVDENAYTVEYQEPLADNGSDFVVTQVAVENQSFDKALHIKTTKTGDQAWDAQIWYNMDKTKEIKKGDTLFFGCKVRGISSVTNKEAMFVTSNTRVRPDRSTSTNLDITSYINADDASDWTQIYGACAAPADSKVDADGAWVFQLGNAIQELEIADVFVINFGQEFSEDEMPVMTKSYLGMEEDAQWRKDALQRIEEIRKEDVSISLVDGDGNPLKDAEVKVGQTRHEFGFGTIVNVDEYNKWDATKQAKFKAAFEQIAHNRAGFENALKHYYVTDSTRQGLVDEWMDYFVEKDIDIRGHVLIYGDDTRLRNVDMSGVSTDMPNKELLMSNTEEGKAALREWTKNHIQTYVDKYEDKIYNWDVVNENMTSHDWADRLGGYDAIVQWFEDAHEADPDAKLTYNDYGILSRDKGHQDYHYELCKYLVDNDAPITTIGIQGHVSLISPIEIINILDRFATLGKEIEITEFTYEDDDPELQAQFTRDFMIAVFSQEAVTSITTWGFYQGCMYQPKAAMVDNNFKLKPNGEVWRDMIYNQWWTNEAGITDANGEFDSRAFKGEHEVTVKVGDVEQTFNITLSDTPVELELVYEDGKIEQKTEQGDGDNSDSDNNDDGNIGESEDTGNTGNTGNIGSSSNNNSGSPSSNAGSNNSSASSKVVASAPLTSIHAQRLPLSEQFMESGKIPYANVTFGVNEAVLKLELMTKYYGRNLYLMAHLGNGIGYTIANEELGKAKEDLNIGSVMEKMEGFAADFDTFHMKPVQEKQLSYEIGLHMNVGAEFAGKTAYLFSKSLEADSYQFNKVMTVNEIGNVALVTSEITDVIILITK